MTSPDNTQHLTDLVLKSCAVVDLRWRDTGHDLTYEEATDARKCLSGVLQTF